MTSLVLNTKAKMPPDQQQVYDFVTSCLDAVGADSLVVFGKQGRLEHDAYYEPLYLEYYYKDLVRRVPSVSVVEVELARYVDEHLDKCVKGFAEFPVVNFTFIAAPDTTVTLAENDVRFDLKYSLKFEKKSVRFNLDKFSVTQKIPLKRYLDMAEHTVSYYHAHKALDMNYFIEGDIPGRAYFHNSTLIIAVEDSSNQLLGQPYLFGFAVG